MDTLTDGFMPHGYCLRWSGPLVLVFILGNLGIAIAYFMIPMALRRFVGLRKDLPYPHMFRLFAAFIFSCGFTHIFKVWTIYQPIYWAEAIVDLSTAGVSLLTAALLWPLIPQALALRSPRELEAEVRRRTEELRESEERLKRLADAIPNICWIAGNDLYIDYLNDRWYQYTGLPGGEGLGHNWRQQLHPDDIEVITSNWPPFSNSNKPFEVEIRIKSADGSYRWFLVRSLPILNDRGEVASWVGTSNAVKFTDAGAVDISVTLLEKTAEIVRLKFAVTDTDTGISQDQQTRIFQPFAQAADTTSRVFGGTGLGLSICRTLAELMNGELGLESIPGKGSTFWAHIPFDDDQCKTK